MGSIIIGSGYRGLTFLEWLPKLGEEIAAVVEINEAKHNFIKWQLEKQGINVPPFYTDYKKAFEEIPYSQADKVFIITPEFTHKEIFNECIKRKYHIFLEKPIATTKNDVADMVNISKDYDKDIQVGFLLRFTDFYIKVKEIISQGLIGKISLIQMNERLTVTRGIPLKKDWHGKWEATGGFFNEKCSHDIDLMLWLKEDQAKPVEIFSYGSQEFGVEKGHPEKCSKCEKPNCPFRNQGDKVLEEFLGEHPEEREKFVSAFENMDKCYFNSGSQVFDTQSAIIIFDDGSHGDFSYILVSGKPGRDILIHGTKGCLEGSFDTGYIKYTIYDTGEVKEITLDLLDKHQGGDERIIKNFLDKTCNNISDKDTLAHGALASVVAFMGDYSMYTGKVESIPKIDEYREFVPFEKYMEKIKK